MRTERGRAHRQWAVAGHPGVRQDGSRGGGDGPGWGKAAGVPAALCRPDLLGKPVCLGAASLDGLLWPPTPQPGSEPRPPASAGLAAGG